MKAHYPVEGGRLVLLFRGSTNQGERSKRGSTVLLGIPLISWKSYSKANISMSVI